MMFIEYSVISSDSSDDLIKRDLTERSHGSIPQHSCLCFPAQNCYKFINPSSSKHSLNSSDSPKEQMEGKEGQEYGINTDAKCLKLDQRLPGLTHFDTMQSIQKLKTMNVSPSISSKKERKLSTDVCVSPMSPLRNCIILRTKIEIADQEVVFSPGEFPPCESIHNEDDSSSSHRPTEFNLGMSEYRLPKLFNGPRSRISATSLQDESEGEKPIDTNIDCSELLKNNKDFMQFFEERTKVRLNSEKVLFWV